MFEDVINSNKYISYLEYIGIDTVPIKSNIQTFLNNDKKRDYIFNSFSNRVYNLISFNIYVENVIFKVLNEYLYNDYSDSVVFENHSKIDIKSIIGYQNSLIERPNITKPSETQEGFTKLLQDNGFIRIARFENELMTEHSSRKGNSIVFEGLIRIEKKISPFFDSQSILLWTGEFRTDNPYNIIGFCKSFNSIEAKYILWIDSELLELLVLTLDDVNNGINAINDVGEVVLKFRYWKEELLGHNMNDNVAKLEGCDLILREDYIKRLINIVGDVKLYTQIVKL